MAPVAMGCRSMATQDLVELGVAKRTDSLSTCQINSRGELKNKRISRKKEIFKERKKGRKEENIQERKMKERN